MGCYSRISQVKHLNSGVLDTWYEEESKTGNYWSSYSGRDNYSIDGNAESVNLYPKKKEIIKSPFLLTVSVVTLLSLISINVLLKRRRS